VLALEGPEISALTPAHLGHCMFELRFKVKIPGTYRVSLKWVREGYTAVQDHVPAWPRGKVLHPLGERHVFVHLGDAGLAAQVHAQVLSARHLPTCIGRPQVSGRWVLKSGPQARFEEHVVSGKLKQAAFVRIEDYEWVPWDCRLDSLMDLVHKEKCLHTGPGKQAAELAIAGDSHGKRIFQAFGTYACRNATAFAAFPVKELCACVKAWGGGG
jgi:hypothetical protein